MKKCPTCDKTFEDSMRFCQVDGTPLVDDEPAFDPYATMVGSPKDFALTEDPVVEADEAAPSEEAPAEPAIPADAPPIAEPDDVLDLPEADPLRTMYVSDAEMEALVSEESVSGPDSADAPLSTESPAPEPPVFNIPDVPAPSFGDVSPPPSPLSAVDNPPFEEKNDPPAPFSEAETMYQSPMDVAAEQPPAPAAQWTPPPAPEASWQNQEIGANTPFQPPPAGTEGQNKTLAIISLICGILSLVCCSWFLPGIAAIVTGFIARGKAKSNPAEYGGEGLALGGIITGGISLVLGVIVIILYMFGALAGALGNNF